MSLIFLAVSVLNIITCYAVNEPPSAALVAWGIVALVAAGLFTALDYRKG